MIEVTFRMKQDHGAEQSASIIRGIKNVFSSDPAFMKESIEIVELKDVPDSDPKKEREFWLNIIMKDDVIDVEQTLKELTDFSFMIHEVPKVYMHITGGLLSKPMYHATGVIGAADEYNRRHYTEVFSEMVDEMKSVGEISANAATNLKHKIETEL